MIKTLKWTAAALVALALLVAAVLFALQRWVGTDDFRSRVQAQAASALGVPVKLGAIEVDAWPLPAVALVGVQVGTQPPLSFGRVEARPAWAALLQGRLEITTLLVRQAVLPQRGIDSLVSSLQKIRKTTASSSTTTPPGSPPPGAIALLARKAVLDSVTWVDAKGVPMTVDAQVQLGDDGWPDSAQFKVQKGRLLGTQARLQRQSDHWTLRMDLGGGSVVGKLRLQVGAKGAASQLTGELETTGVEVSALTAPSRTLTGQLQASTTLRASFREPGDLAEALRSDTRFTVKDAVVHGIDLAAAVKSVGLNRGGETRLETLAGQVTTQGRAMALNNLVANSSLLAATGNVAVAPDRSLSGRINAELAAGKLTGAVAVPLTVGGTLDAPSVSVARSALLGAAIGTAVLPGAGTAAGAKLGDKLGNLFGR